MWVDAVVTFCRRRFILNPSKRLDSIIHNSIEDWALAQSKAEIPGEEVVSSGQSIIHLR